MTSIVTAAVVNCIINTFLIAYVGFVNLVKSAQYFIVQTNCGTSLMADPVPVDQCQSHSGRSAFDNEKNGLSVCTGDISVYILMSHR